MAPNIHGKNNKVGSLVVLEKGQLLSGGYDGKIILWNCNGGFKKEKDVLDVSTLTK